MAAGRVGALAARLPLTTLAVGATVVLGVAGAFIGSLAPRVFEDCPTPVLVLKRFQVVNSLLAPFLYPAHASASVVAWLFAQLVGFAALAVVDQSFLKENPGRLRTLLVLAGLSWIGTLIARVILGYVFARAVGWAYPSLFFNESSHECQTGLCTWLWALTFVTMPFWSMQSVTLRLQGRAYAIRLWAVQFILLVLGCTTQDGFWFTASACIATLVIVPWVVVQISSSTPSSTATGSRLSSRRANTRADGDFLPPPAASKKRKTATRNPIREALLVSVLCMLAFVAALITRWAQPDELPATDQEIMGLVSESAQHLLTVLIVTAPRPGNPGHLWKTISSFTPHLLPVGSPGAGTDLYRIYVSTTFSEHDEFSAARAQLETHSQVLFVQQQAEEVHRPYQKQRRDFALAIQAAKESLRSEYIMFVEDDFPLCEDAWPSINTLLARAHKAVPNHCGLFVATGGSGLIFRSDMAATLSRLLLDFNHPLLSEAHPDIIMQQCLRGTFPDPECLRCANTLVTSQRMLMKHIGFNTSTTMHRYGEEQYQCGWRQPFNGEADVVTL